MYQVLPSGGYSELKIVLVLKVSKLKRKYRQETAKYLYAPTCTRYSDEISRERHVSMGKLGEEIVGEMYEWLQPAGLRIQRHKKPMQLNQ